VKAVYRNRVGGICNWLLTREYLLFGVAATMVSVTGYVKLIRNPTCLARRLRHLARLCGDQVSVHVSLIGEGVLGMDCNASDGNGQIL
jgi:hypothetical protein